MCTATVPTPSINSALVSLLFRPASGTKILLHSIAKKPKRWFHQGGGKMPFPLPPAKVPVGYEASGTLPWGSWEQEGRYHGGTPEDRMGCSSSQVSLGLVEMP